MASTKTGIEWTDKTWNPTTGCDKVSPGCAHCYAKTMTERFPDAFPNGFKLTLHPDRLDQPRHWRKPSKIFVNSMSDLFHKDVPLEFIQQVFDVMRETPRHTYQILTKRNQRLVELAPMLEWPSNVWMGVSVERWIHVNRVDALRQVPAAVRFISCEPLLGPTELNLDGIHWVIVGGESGPGYRSMDPNWARGIRDQCIAANVPFFFKQWDGVRPKSRGRFLDGQEWQQFPEETLCLSR
jgi:protein gp37